MINLFLLNDQNYNLSFNKNLYSLGNIYIYIFIKKNTNIIYNEMSTSHPYTILY